jgi:hypothetical protein
MYAALLQLFGFLLLEALHHSHSSYEAQMQLHHLVQGCCTTSAFLHVVNKATSLTVSVIVCDCAVYTCLL